MKWVYLNNQFIEKEKAALLLNDLSIQRGYGIFDFFRLAGNKPLFLDDYLDRFYQSAERMRLQVPQEREELKTTIRELIVRNNTNDTGIKLNLAGGYSEDGISITRPNFFITQHSYEPPSTEQQENGVKLVTYQHQRQLPDVKTIDYLMSIWLRPFVQQVNAYEVLYYNHSGEVSECPRNNFFIVTKEDTIVTPDKNVLKGITRKKLLAAATKSFKVEERTLTLDEVKQAKEAFITSTTKGVLSVAQVDDSVFKEKAVLQQLKAMFQQLVKKEINKLEQ
jgi:D-alanine transaminase/branched-chain amino acid aminotransferase